MTLLHKRNNDISGVFDAEKTITLEDLKINFPATHESKKFAYSGKCNYCDVEINFSDITQVKIKVTCNEKSQKLSLHHKGCFERYRRRTIN